MKILTMNYEFPPVGGGGGRVAARVGSGLAARGHEVTVLTSHYRHLPRKEQREGMTILRVRCCRHRAERSTILEMAAFLVASVYPALRLIRRFKPDVIHVHFAVPTGPTAWIGWLLTSVPYVLTAHLGDVPGGVPTQTDRLFRFVKPLTVPIWRHATAVTAVSRFVADLSERAYGIVPRVIPNGIDFSSFPERRKPVSHPVRLIWVGRIQEQKNLPFGMRQLAEIGDLPWTLDVVGDGPERDLAEQAVRTGGLTNKVRFLGWLEQDEVRDLMRRADILYLPSLSEGLALVSLEALASGLAIVASRIGGVDEVVKDGVNGFLCPLEEPGSFVRRLRRLMTDLPLLEKMQQASLRNAAMFSWERSLEQYETVLLEAARQGLHT